MPWNSGIHKGFTCLCIVPFDLLGPASPRRLCHGVLKAYMRCIDSRNHPIFAYLNIISFLSQEREFLITQKQKKEVFFHEVQLEYFILFYWIDHRPIPLFYLGVLNTPIILSFILLFPRDISDSGHPNSIDWDDSFIFLICKIKISIKSHIAIY